MTQVFTGSTEAGALNWAHWNYAAIAPYVGKFFFDHGGGNP